MAGGAAVMLRELLSEISGDQYAVLTEHLSAFIGCPAEDWLPTRHYFFGSDTAVTRSDAAAAVRRLTVQQGDTTGRRILRSALKTAKEVLDVTEKVRRLSRQAIRTIEKERPDVVLGLSGDPVFLVAAAIAARATGTRLYVHLFDLFAQNHYQLPKRMLAARHERAILTQANFVFVPNRAMAAYYHGLIGISPVVIPNGTAIPPRPILRQVSKTPTVLYTGAIYWAQQEAIRNLVIALRSLPEVKLEIRTAATKRALTQVGVRSESEVLPFGSHNEVIRAQRDADILFLPLAFHTSAPNVIRTAFPAKTAEYFVSGNPILVHAPPDAYISQYARSAKWGYVVDTEDLGALKRAVELLLSDSDLRSSLATRAYDQAVAHHDWVKIRTHYASYLS